jgi:hypothetical protein
MPSRFCLTLSAMGVMPIALNESSSSDSSADSLTNPANAAVLVYRPDKQTAVTGILVSQVSDKLVEHRNTCLLVVQSGTDRLVISDSSTFIALDWLRCFHNATAYYADKGRRAS